MAGEPFGERKCHGVIRLRHAALASIIPSRFRRRRNKFPAATFVVGPILGRIWEAEVAFEEIIETRPTGWLAILERELKLRIGWADEALSPFARPVPEVAPSADDDLKSAA
jgi:hypothetical protein